MESETSNPMDVARENGRVKGRVEACAELNAYLGNHLGFLGFIWWFGVHNLVKKWIDENDKLIAKMGK